MIPLWLHEPSTVSLTTESPGSKLPGLFAYRVISIGGWGGLVGCHGFYGLDRHVTASVSAINKLHAS